jgi:hypothetical protein
MNLFGRSCLVAVALLLMQLPLRAMAEDAVAPAASQPASAIDPRDILGDGAADPVADAIRQRAEEQRADAKQAIDALNRWLIDEMVSGRYSGRSLDVRQWISDLETAKQAIDDGKPLSEVDKIGKALENDIRRDEEKEAEARRMAGGCQYEVKTSAEGDETENDPNVVRTFGKVRILLELLEIALSCH